MAGSLLAQDGRLFRLGQDFSASYGDGLCFFEIDTLEPDTYSECLIGTFKFKERAGPHTINALPDGYVFDWYREKFSPMAGIRRLRARSLPLSSRSHNITCALSS